MGLDIYFVYDAEDKSVFEAEETACRGLQDLFEIYDHVTDPIGVAKAQNAALNTPFVRDFPKMQEMSFTDTPPREEGMEAVLESDLSYTGPSFEPKVLTKWAQTWIEIIESMDSDEQTMLLPLATENYNWVPDLLDDLRRILAQGECALKHRTYLHIEMY